MIKLWYNYNKAIDTFIEKKGDNERILETKYEELVKNPESEMRKIADFMQLSVKSKVDFGITSHNANRYLNRNDNFIINDDAKSMLSEYGYQL
jgi:hypothetical protein